MTLSRSQWRQLVIEVRWHQRRLRVIEARRQQRRQRLIRGIVWGLAWAAVLVVLVIYAAYGTSWLRAVAPLVPTARAQELAEPEAAAEEGDAYARISAAQGAATEGVSAGMRGTGPTSAPSESSVSVEQLIRDAAARWGLDAGVLLRIAWCESQLGAHWRTNHPANPHRGVFQMNRATWEEHAGEIGIAADWNAASDAAFNIELAAYLMAKSQWWRWACG